MVHGEAPKSFLASFLFAVRRLLGIATFVLVLVLLLPKVFLLFDNPKSASFSATLLEARDIVLKKSAPLLHHYVPTNIAGADRSDWILIGLAMIVTFIAGSLAQRNQQSLNRRILRKSAQAWRKKEGVKPGSALDNELESTLRAAEAGNAVNRQERLVFSPRPRRSSIPSAAKWLFWRSTSSRQPQ